MDDPRNYFISYHRADQQWAEWIAVELEKAGFTTILQAWDFAPGTNWVLAMDQAAQRSRQTIAVLSTDFLQSGFTAAEWAAAIAQDPTVKGLREQRWKPAAVPFPRRRNWIGLAVVSATGVGALGVWAILPSREPEVYQIRVRALLPDGRPAEGAKLVVSSSAEIKQTAAGWEVAVPRVGLPADRRLNLVATLDSAFLRGGATVVLGHDPAPAVQIPLHINRSALVRGTVVDSQGRSLAGARVSVEGFPESITTGRTGSFELPAHAADGQSVRVRAEHSGFTGTTTTVLAGETPVQIVMDRQ